MKMERLNEHQIKIYLAKEDLIQRDIKIIELVYGGQKAINFFKELMKIAEKEHDFYIKNSNVMVEAIPISVDSITLIVTKAEHPQDIEKVLNKATKRAQKLKDELEEILAENPNTNCINNISALYSFSNIDTIISLSKRLNSIFKGKSTIYKINHTFFLYLEPSKLCDFSKIDAILKEYGQQHICTLETKFYFLEHAQSIVKNNAIYKLHTC